MESGNPVESLFYKHQMAITLRNIEAYWISTPVKCLYSSAQITATLQNIKKCNNNAVMVA